MSVQIVLNEGDACRLRIGSFQFLHEFGVLFRCSAGTNFDEASPGQRFNGQEHDGTPETLILVVLPGDLTRFHGNRGQFVADQKAGLFIEAQHGILLVIGSHVHVQHPFHLAQKSRGQLRDAPLLFAVRLDFVFFNM